MNVASVLDAVTVYARGALCTRVAKLAEGAGPAVRVLGLPVALHAGSLRARLDGAPTGARVLDVRPAWQVELAAETDVPREQQAFEAATAEVARLTAEHARVEREIAELTRLKPSFPPAKPGDPPRSAPVEALLKAAEFVSQQLGRRFDARRTLAEALADANDELELRRRRLQEASAAVRTQRARLSRVAAITLSGPVAEARLAVEYFVPGARWSPSYALQLERGMTSGRLSTRAAVAQATGEDWSQVRLSLSTAALDRATALPELKSLRIGRAQPPPARTGWRDPPPGLDELFSGFEAAHSRRPGTPPVGAASMRMSPAVDSLAAAGMPASAPPPTPAMPRAPSPGRSMPDPTAMAALHRQRKLAASTNLPRGAEAQTGAIGGLGRRGPPADAQLEEAGLDDEAPYERELGVVAETALEPPPAPALELGAQLLDYGNLFMAAPGVGRGRLQPSTEQSVLALAAVSLDVSVLIAVLGQSVIVAKQVEQLPVPARCAEPTGGSFDYRYDCAARVDVPSRGEWTVVPVADADVGLTAEYACVPSVEPQVYRTLRVHNRSTHALLRGPVDVTLGDEFLMTTDLPLIAAGATDARLGLGVEEAIKVARKTHFKESTGGLLGGSTLLPHDVEIEIANRLAAPALVEVRERVPFSLDADVKIEEVSVKPAWEKDESLRDGAVVRGARAWRVTVPPNEKTTLTAQYVVRIPSDKMLVGGNRRA